MGPGLERISWSDRLVRPRSFWGLGWGRLVTRRNNRAASDSKGTASHVAAVTRRPVSVMHNKASKSTVRRPTATSRWAGSRPARQAQSASQNGREMLPPRWAAKSTGIAPAMAKSSTTSQRGLRRAAALAARTGQNPHAKSFTTVAKRSARQGPSSSAMPWVAVSKWASAVAKTIPTRLPVAMRDSRRRLRPACSPNNVPSTAPKAAAVAPATPTRLQVSVSAARKSSSSRSGWRMVCHLLLCSDCSETERAWPQGANAIA